MASSGPKIHRLEECVVNRIAAGEVVQRPSAALKEMLENSLDAGSTQITVSVKAGGMSVLQIQDNGHGIHKDDLQIVCERFTTSKLTSFEDLSKISTFGFRGEALASITHVAKVTIISKTASSSCAYKALYKDGQMISPNGGVPEPKPMAGVVGTTILVEDLFYNMPTRRQAFKNASEQYQKILDILTRYSIHFGNTVSFVCKKVGQSVPDLSFPTNSSVLDNIRLAFGSQLTKDIINVKNEFKNETVSFSLEGKISNGNFAGKKSVLILFINNRLVESLSIKRLIDSIYDHILPKNAHPFVYLSITMPPHQLDVNVHPTKREVHFLEEECLLELIGSTISDSLKCSNESRSFQTQSVLTYFSQSEEPSAEEPESEAVRVDRVDSHPQEASKSPKPHPSLGAIHIPAGDSATLSTPSSLISPVVPLRNDSNRQSLKRRDPPQVVAAHKLVRTDPKLVGIQSFFKPVASESMCVKSISADCASSGGCPSGCSCLSLSTMTFCAPIITVELNSRLDSTHSTFQRSILETTCEYDSVRQLLAEINTQSSSTLQRMIQNSTFVGIVNTSSYLCQFETKLYLVDFLYLSEHLFYQLVVRKFGILSKFALSPSLSLRQCINEAVLISDLSYPESVDGNQEVSRNIKELLVEKADMLREYFNIDISSDGELTSIPLILEQIQPDLLEISAFFVRLAVSVNWKDELDCFRGIACELALLYTRSIFNQISSLSQSDRGRLIGSILIPAFKYNLKVPTFAHEDKGLVQITSLEQLYRVFERC